jgi:hypothetical protein
MPRKLQLDFHPPWPGPPPTETGRESFLQKRQDFFKQRLDDVHGKSVHMNALPVKPGFASGQRGKRLAGGVGILVDLQAQRVE